MNKYLMTSVAALVLSLAGCSNIERSRDLGDPSVTGQTLAQQVCSNCHGVDGNSVSPAFPRLAGQQPAYITSQLVNFRSHARMDPPGYQYMWGLSRSLTDAQIAGLAAYYAAQPVRLAPSAPPNAKLMAVGQTIFEQGVRHRLQRLPWPQGPGHRRFPAPGEPTCRLPRQAAQRVPKHPAATRYAHGVRGAPPDRRRQGGRGHLPAVLPSVMACAPLLTETIP